MRDIIFTKISFIYHDLISLVNGRNTKLYLPIFFELLKKISLYQQAEIALTEEFSLTKNGLSLINEIARIFEKLFLHFLITLDLLNDSFCGH